MLSIRREIVNPADAGELSAAYRIFIRDRMGRVRTNGVRIRRYRAVRHDEQSADRMRKESQT